MEEDPDASHRVRLILESAAYREANQDLPEPTRVGRLARGKASCEAVCRTLQLGNSTGKEGEAWNILSQLPKDLKTLSMQAGEAQLTEWR